MGFYALLAGLSLLFISFFIKSILIKFAIILCMLTFIFLPAYKDTYLQAAAAVIISYCVVSGFLHVFEGPSGGI